MSLYTSIKMLNIVRNLKIYSHRSMFKSIARTYRRERTNVIKAKKVNKQTDEGTCMNKTTGVNTLIFSNFLKEKGLPPAQADVLSQSFQDLFFVITETTKELFAKSEQKLDKIEHSKLSDDFATVKDDLHKTLLEMERAAINLYRFFIRIGVAIIGLFLGLALGLFRLFGLEINIRK